MDDLLGRCGMGKHCVDRREMVRSANDSGLTPLQLALKWGQPVAVRKLLGTAELPLNQAQDAMSWLQSHKLVKLCTGLILHHLTLSCDCKPEICLHRGWHPASAMGRGVGG